MFRAFPSERRFLVFTVVEYFQLHPWSEFSKRKLVALGRWDLEEKKIIVLFEEFFVLETSIGTHLFKVDYV